MRRYNEKQNLGEFDFLQMPRTIFNRRDISIKAKYLYMAMYDRIKISIKNNLVDEKGDFYIYYSLESIQELLQVSKKTALKVKKELVNVELIEEKRQGLTKPNRIYVGISLKCKKDNSRNSNNTSQKLSQVHSNYNKINYNKNNYITEGDFDLLG